MLRTHTCGELRKEQIGESVSVCGWVQTRRDHGGVIFVDLRDRFGLTQVVFDPEHSKQAHHTAEHLGREWVLQCKGKVRARKEGMTNPKLATGEVEVIVDELVILNRSEMPPFEIEDDINVNEELRLKFRYLDLRRPVMQRRLQMRHNVRQAARTYLAANNFVEISTPMLVKPTPEGARDCLVPSRIHPGKFYALPQSPQIYKQLLMCAGFDRYFQFAYCIRDEDGRADRQLEHQQIDLEMSFVTKEDVFTAVEGLMKSIWKECLGYDVQTPFRRIDHEEALQVYGSDKPDLRFGLEMQTVTDTFKDSGFGMVEKAIEGGAIVKGLKVEGKADFSRKELDELIKIAQTYHAKGLAWFKVNEGKLEGGVAKYIKEEKHKEILEVLGAKDGDLLLFVADKKSVACTSLGQVRLFLGEKLGLIDKSKFIFCWIINFPLFEWDDETERWEHAHHPFCMPREEHIQYLDKPEELGKVYCEQYDLALNGTELCSGSIRINRPDVQEKVLNAIGMSKEEAEKKFGFLMEAFKYGAPPHGGVGLGLDRITGLLCDGLTDIKEVIAFPKNKKSECPMDGSPSPADPAQVKELHLKLDLAK